MATSTHVRPLHRLVALRQRYLYFASSLIAKHDSPLGQGKDYLDRSHHALSLKASPCIFHERICPILQQQLCCFEVGSGNSFMQGCRAFRKSRKMMKVCTMPQQLQPKPSSVSYPPPHVSVLCVSHSTEMVQQSVLSTLLSVTMLFNRRL